MNDNKKLTANSSTGAAVSLAMDKEYYCDCTNPDCGMYYMTMNPDDPCPECGESVEPSQCDEGW